MQRAHQILGFRTDRAFPLNFDVVQVVQACQERADGFLRRLAPGVPEGRGQDHFGNFAVTAAGHFLLVPVFRQPNPRTLRQPDEEPAQYPFVI